MMSAMGSLLHGQQSMRNVVGIGALFIALLDTPALSGFDERIAVPEAHEHNLLGPVLVTNGDGVEANRAAARRVAIEFELRGGDRVLKASDLGQAAGEEGL